MLKMKGKRFPKEIILLCVRWYAAYPLSYRNLEEMMQERGVYVDHSSVSRWAIKFLPLLEKVFRKHKRAVGASWRMDETYIKVNGQWKYLYRAVDKEGATIDFLLRARRDTAAATRFFDKAMRQNGFKSFRSASAVLAGIELLHMIRKGQMSTEKGMGLSFAKQFYALAA
ncbi:MAG TPA: IS6 family transposase [Polaromonas sp.]|jgi:transposase-like protein|uniref:IS6 family transposase n=1 Tax=unclassified Polaromonas TaxID=2638319 RepID=UPI000BDA8E30|nr:MULTISPECIES: IS6 family transposase [unclassified Polaromonas]OYY39335.1 MAG: hypothetical protein B7Y60_03530 [Polaromonas sp. 35-63-35]OYZ20434.1 MAG: hypothetical protein B7Y28_09120 [Polaromonas sp. 16-63-31]OYZ80639.1 MAG: hypothetical protein B7Y09_05585 [Polaromonas sp. 24-63-21]OZA51702.1 MAG: hypothetical protein B7X88_09015 [Polaromonas sp. 17-63-33]OZA89830.1 MAG: hypothetical protein B7X65_00190 [Polaromonas sp. 39-63-25]